MIHVAMVGCGKMAHWHAEQLKAIEDVKVVALVDVDPKHSHEFKEKFFPEAGEFTLFNDLLSSPPAKLDAVVIVTPHAAHYPECKTALEHGLHVLVEKPMVTRLEHALELEALAKKTGKLLGIAFQAPYTAEYGYLAAERDAGRLGRIQMISGWLTQDWLKATAGKWRQEPAIAGGGMLYDSGAHLLNAMIWLINEPVVEVGCFCDNAGSAVDINGVAILRFANGAFASIAIGGNCPPFRTEIQIQTDRMLIVTDQYGGKLEMTGHKGRKLYPNVKMSDENAANTPHRNFVDAILGRDTLRAPVRYGVMLSALMDAMYESARKRGIVKVRPVIV